ncbi:hypothetical protein [Streptomyces sp. IMTB 1903]|uniref:hypothetical protein n=1 Tax=Streptomyces sp. IMTB 1903 TaxID=1776680 RepID=UPI001F380DDE|nr:hypothetical protein [Streptomyces sp. IMTB 1903]
MLQSPLPFRPDFVATNRINGTGRIHQGFHTSSRKAGDQVGQGDVAEGASLHTSIIRSLRLTGQEFQPLGSVFTRQGGALTAAELSTFIRTLLSTSMRTRAGRLGYCPQEPVV